METLDIREITPDADKALADMIRFSLKKHKLDIPGTAYFDKELDHLSDFYQKGTDDRKYFVLTIDGRICGGMGYSKFDKIENCAELQKLYLTQDCIGKGLGGMLFDFVENEARKAGFKKAYIETHTNLDAAIKMYLKRGYELIDRPDFVFHSSMDAFLIKEL